MDAWKTTNISGFALQVNDTEAEAAAPAGATPATLD